MGSIWIRDLDTVLRNAGLKVREWSGWENRSRSSGGYDQVWGIVIHHTASNTAPDNDCGYMWNNADDRPIGAVLLERDGRVSVGAAGATNTAGKGGAWTTSKGTIPLDKGNTYTFNIEAANAGTGENWPQAQQDAYVVLVRAICTKFGLDPKRDVYAHFEWAPGRKYDPAGPSAWGGAGQDLWDMNAFRADVASGTGPPPSDDELTEEEVQEILAAIAALQKDVDGLVTNSANRYADLEAKINRNRDHVDGLATNESNRYAQYVGWHDEVMGALDKPTSSAALADEPPPETEPTPVEDV